MRKKIYFTILALIFFLAPVSALLNLPKNPSVLQFNSPIAVNDFKLENFPLPNSQPIYSFKINVQIKLTGNNALGRIILVDKSNQEYLVYETASAFAEKSEFSVTDACEETCILNGVIPDHYRVEGENSVLIVTQLKPNSNKIVGADLIQNSQKIKLAQDNLKIEALNKKIISAHKNWLAGETSVSRLTYAQKKRLFAAPKDQPNVLPNLQGFEYYKGGVFEKLSSPSPSDPPNPPSIYRAAWNWRNVHGQNWISPVRNQLGCASCWAFAAVGVTESTANLYYNQYLDINLSEQESVCLHPGSCTYGGFSSDTLNELKTNGLATENCYPYLGTETCPGRCVNWESTLWKINAYDTVPTWPQIDDIIKKYLITKGPVTFNLPSWWHIVTLVGYTTSSNNQTVWIIKNSWGPDWGENGFGNLILPQSERYAGQFIIKPYPANQPAPTINCYDKDKDHYCNWGISETQPKSCLKLNCLPEKDCDDTNPRLGEFGSDFNCKPVSPSPSPSFKSSPQPSLCPICNGRFCPKFPCRM